MFSREREGRGFAWLVFVLVTVAAYGNFYVYDSIGPVADLLHRQRAFSDTQIGMLNAIYSMPNVVLVLVGGVLVDRFGAARVTLWTTTVCLAGAVLTALSPSFGGMAAGRLLFGIGAETFNIGILAAIAQYFAGRNIAFANGVKSCGQPSWIILRRHVTFVVRQRLRSRLATAAANRDDICGNITCRRHRLLVGGPNRQPQ
jgi:MFS family permease